MRGKWLVATAAVLICAVSARADVWLTTKSQITNQNVPSNTGALPGPVAGAGSPITYDSLTGSSLGGVSYTNAFASGPVIPTTTVRTVVLGDTVHELGVDLFPTGFTNGGPTGSLLNNTNVTAVFAGTGTVTATIPGSGVLAASFQQLVVNIYNRGSTAIDRNDPSTWGISAANLITQYVLHVAPGGSTVVPGPTGFAVVVPAALNNSGVANPATGITSNSFFIIDKTAAGLGNNYLGPTPLEVELNELVQQSTQTGVGGALNQTTANAAFAALFASAGIIPNGGNFFSAPDGTTDTSFAPSGPPGFANGDVVQTAGATVYPLVSTSQIPPGVPEPASMLIWGLGALGVGAYVRRRQSKKAA